MEISIVWLRRDLRLDDNTALNEALKSGLPVLPLFIFDEDIITHLQKNDARVEFIYNQIREIDEQLIQNNSGLLVKKGVPIQVWKNLVSDFKIKKVFFNHDYEPYATKRDETIISFLKSRNISVSHFKDQVIFEKSEVVKKDGKPYTVFTPYKKIWLQKYHELNLTFKNAAPHYLDYSSKIPSLSEIGFISSSIKISEINKKHITDYDKIRDFPSVDGGTNLGIQLRFGTVSIRKTVKYISSKNDILLSELIWREFFKQILHHFPRVVSENFYRKYDGIEWLNDENLFQKWCSGTTGYPMVDAGMRELNKTGRMHNRVRMITASFLCKHLLIDWRWGEAYFAEKLLDYELSANNGNWQWAAGTGCDSSPYFRVFNPTAQQQKFDKAGEYIKRWIPEIDTLDYPKPIVEHAFARTRAIETYKKGILV